MKIQQNKAYIGDITAYPFKDDDLETSAVQVVDFLNENTDVELYINSGGGDVFEAFQIYNALRRHARTNSVKVYVDGLAASAASYLMFGGSELFVPKNATIMIHKPSTIAWGNADELRKSAEALDVIQSNIESIYVDNAKNLSAVQIRHLMNATTWFDGADFADKFKCTVIDELGADKTTENKVLNTFKAKISQEEKRRQDIADFMTKEAAKTNTQEDNLWEIRREFA